MELKSFILARKILSKVCEDREISSLEYDVYYHNDVIEGEVKSFRMDKQGYEITMEVLTENGSYCLFTLEPADAMWEEFGGYAENRELQIVHRVAYEKIAKRCKAVFDEVLNEAKEIKEVAEPVMVKYAILAADGPLVYSYEKLCDCGEFILPQFGRVLSRGECRVEMEPVTCIAADYLADKGLNVCSGQVIFYQVEGDEPRAVLMSDIGRPALRNGGGMIGESLCQKVQTFNYTLDTVANSNYVFLFAEKSVVPAGEIDLCGTSLCVELDWELQEWRVVVSDHIRDHYYGAKGYSCFEEAREALQRDKFELSGYVHWSRKPMIEVSPFGLKSLKKGFELRREVG